MNLNDLLARFVDLTPEKLAIRFPPPGIEDALGARGGGREAQIASVEGSDARSRDAGNAGTLSRSGNAADGPTPPQDGPADLHHGLLADEWSYQRLFGAGRTTAERLSARGVEPGDRVAVLLGNRPEMVTTYLGLLRLGAAMVPINLGYRAREIGHILEDAEPRLVLTDAEHIGVMEGLHRSVLDVDDLAQSTVQAPSNLDRAPATLPPEADGTAAALVLYTSGTTGRSKGAVLSHANVAATVLSLHEAWAWRPNDVLLLALPLFHTHGLVVGLHCALAAGATVHLHRRFKAAAVAEDLIAAEPTLFFGVPTMYVRLLDELPSVDLSHMRLFCSGSAPLDPETFAAFRQLTGHSILERYGMTETGMLLSNPYDGIRLPGTVGRELPGVTARVVNDAAEELPDGEEGELVVRGSNVFSGYWRSPEKTRASFSEDSDGTSWFHTGDLARRDPENGYYSLLGRRHELIISGGFNIYPREVEEVLTSLPGILEAAVVGHPHPEWGEEVVGFLVTDGPFDEAAIVATCKEHLASFKVPRHVHRIERLPRNALGKVQKHLLPDP